MKKSCSYCGGAHDAGYICPAKPPRRAASTPARKARNKNQWKKVKREANERDHNLCRACLAGNTLTYNDLETHHIVPIEEDITKAYDEGNAVTLCRMHHEQAERGEIERQTLFAWAASEASVSNPP